MGLSSWAAFKLERPETVPNHLRPSVSGHQRVNRNQPRQHHTTRPIDDANTNTRSLLQYVNVHLNTTTPVVGLLDSGSTINIISFDLFCALKDAHISNGTSEEILLANGQTISIKGKTTLHVSSLHGKGYQTFYVFDRTSHPLILGAAFLYDFNVVLDFTNRSFHRNHHCKVRAVHALTLSPNTESIVWAKLPHLVRIGTQGVCQTKNPKFSKFLCARGVITKHPRNRIPVKLFNPSSAAVSIRKGSVICDFEPFHSGTRIHLPTCNANDSFPSCPNDDNIHKFITDNGLKASDNLSDVMKNDLYKTLYAKRKAFVTENNPDLGKCDSAELSIKLRPDAKPKHQKPYRLAPEKKIVLEHQIQHLLDQGIIAPLSEKDVVPISSPVVLVEKKNKPDKALHASEKERSLQSFRFCVDFRYLNSQTEEFRYPIPDIQDLTETVNRSQPNFISCMDLSSGFFQLKLSDSSSNYTAFNTHLGGFKFLRVPQGIKTAPNYFAFCMDKLLKQSSLSHSSVLCYIDDCILFTQTWKSHLSDLNILLDCFISAGLKLNPKKCQFARDRCIFLGHEISAEGMKPPDDKITIVQNYPRPKNQKELKRFLSFMNWFRKFIPNFSATAFPLSELLKKYTKFNWTEECEIAFSKLKDTFIQSKALSYPRTDLPLNLSVDSSSRGTGYMLYYVLPEDECPGVSSEERVRVIRFGSKSLKKYQRSYGPTKLELLGMVHAVLDCAPYLRGRHFTIQCDHQCLKPLFQKQFRGAIYERWLTILQNFSFDIVYKPASDMCVPDALSRCPPEAYGNEVDSPVENDPHFPYVSEPPTHINLPTGQRLEDLLKATSSDDENLGTDEFLPVVQAVQNVSHSTTDNKCEDVTYTSPFASSNRFSVLQIEDQTDSYDADSESDDQNRKSDTVDATIRSRSKMTNALTSKQTKLKPSTSVDKHPNQPSLAEPNTTSLEDTEIYYDANDTCEDLSTTDSCHLTNDSIDERIQNLLTSINMFKTSDLSPDSVAELQLNDSDLKPMIEYLKTGVLPSSQKMSRQILIKSSDYVLADNLLLHTTVPKTKRKQATSKQYQIVVPKVMQQTIIELYHDSCLAGHSGITATIDRLKEDYFFERMSVLVTEYVKSCTACQKRKITKHTKMLVTAMPIPSKPFEVFQIDLYGPLPTTTQGNCYIFTAVDLFSKFIFAKALRAKDSFTVSEAVFELCTTYGTPDCLVSDLGSEFTSSVTKELCSLLRVPLQFAPALCHFVLGACERTHRTLGERLTPYVNEYKNNWDSFLCAIIFSINTSLHNSLQYSPFEILYGYKPSFPLNNSANTRSPDGISKDTKSYLSKQEQKMKIIHDNVRQNALKAQQTMCKRENVSSNLLEVAVGDYVYLRVEPTGKGQKLQNMYEGPFVIHEILSPHIVKLKDSKSKLLANPVHLNRLKRAHVRENNPYPFLTKANEDILHFVSNEHQQSTDVEGPPSQCIPNNITNTTDNELVVQPARRSARLQNKTSPQYNKSILDFVMSSSDSGDHVMKIRKVLGQKQCGKDTMYLVHLKGESANNSRWVTYSELDRKAQSNVQNNPPPFL